MSGALVWENDGKDWPHRENSRFVEAGGLRWHVQVAGTGPVMLLIHGTGASSHSWRELFTRLAAHFTLVVPDLPGHGFTEAPASSRLSLGGMTTALQALLNRLELMPQIIVGHSAGAAIAIRMALDSREKPKALVGINAALMPFGGLAGQLFPVMARMLVLNPFVPRFFAWRATDPQAVNRLIDGTGSRLDETGLSFYRKLFGSSNHVGSTLGMMAQWSLEGLIRDMRKLTIPLTLIVGDNDKAVPPEDARKIKRIMPRAAILHVPRAGHLCHEEQPDTVHSMIMECAAQVTADLQQDDQGETPGRKAS